jgi:catechol 2,3-dioxygenase-like lactoylglutathione lyase family enzyme
MPRRHGNPYLLLKAPTLVALRGGRMLERYRVVPSFPAADLERATRFYTERLGLTPISRNDTAVQFRSGGIRFGIYQTDHAGTAQHTLGAWEVDDIEEAVDELRSRGVVFEEYDFPGLKTVGGIADMGSERGAWFRDSEGNILALAQTIPAAARKEAVR